MTSHNITRVLARTVRATLLTSLAMTAMVTAAHATNLVTNGSFEQTTLPGNSGIGSGFNSNADNVTGWTTSGYNFVYTSAADVTPANGVELWGPANGSANGLGVSPDGGNYVAMDGAYGVGALSQIISGLVIGQQYTVNFYFAGAQQHGFNGSTTEQFEVSFGSDHLFTQVLNNANHGFTGWQSESFTYTASATSETLAFLAIGTPDGVPPFSLLDGVSLNAVAPTPEPGSLALLATGLFGVGGIVRSRFSKATAKKA